MSYNLSCDAGSACDAGDVNVLNKPIHILPIIVCRAGTEDTSDYSDDDDENISPKPIDALDIAIYDYKIMVGVDNIELQQLIQYRDGLKVSAKYTAIVLDNMMKPSKSPRTILDEMGCN